MLDRAGSARSNARWIRQAAILAMLSSALACRSAGQLGVVDGRCRLLAIGQEVVDERLRRLALCLIGLLLVGDDPGLRGDRVRSVAVGPTGEEGQVVG